MQENLNASSQNGKHTHTNIGVIIKSKGERKNLL